jgi:DNA-binding XRE family transcriptional regulator
MSKDVQGNYIRTHRRKCDLSQRDLGVLIGYGWEDRGSAVSRHERSNSAPPLLIALAYEVVFKVPVAEIFAGFHAAVAGLVARNLEELKAEWQNQGEARRILSAEKLEWLSKQGID